MSTILLVDDEQDTLDLFADVLAQMDHQLLTAHDGGEALALAQRTPPDLVVTDWMMPRMDGLELCHRLHGDARLRSIPIIVHSSSGDPHVPGTQFVPKDHPLDQFESLVTRVLASSHARRAAASGGHEGPRAAPGEAAKTANPSRSSSHSGPRANTRITAH